MMFLTSCYGIMCAYINVILQPRPTTPAPNPADEGYSDDDAIPSRRGECGEDTNGDRIYGGQFTELDEFPWMALLGYRKRKLIITK